MRKLTILFALLTLSVGLWAKGQPLSYDSAKAEDLSVMGVPCTDCTAVEVTNGETTITLYNATEVDYKVIEN